MDAMVIIGAGHTGCQTARTLRQDGWRGPIVLVGAEAEPPYERPPLSKGVLTGAKTMADCALFDAPALERQGIELRAGVHALAIDREGRAIALDDGSRLRYGRLLLATGAEPRRLPVPGVEPDRIRYLRSAADARGLGGVLAPGHRLAIVGGGFIGLEVAASAVARGCVVTVIEAGARLMMRSVPAAIEERVAARHRAAGVRILLGRQVAALRRDGAGTRVTLDDGGEFHADTVLAAIGVAPRTALAEAAGLAVDNGIAVDAALRTGDPAILAAGDVCSFPHDLYGARIRLECWKGAEDQGALAARTMLGAAEPYRGVPWLWSDQYDLGIQVAGLPGFGTHSVTRALPDGGLLVFHLAADGRLMAASGVGADGAVGRDIRLAQLMIERQARPGAEALADPAVRLKSLLVAKAA
jgi:3-phenylpropionate/trans-cinnamate dioxygenase ferredoxin reductase subunit